MQGFAEKIQGIKEQAKGKIVGNPDLVEQGHLRQTGELKRREEEKVRSLYWSTSHSGPLNFFVIG